MAAAKDPNAKWAKYYATMAAKRAAKTEIDAAQRCREAADEERAYRRSPEGRAAHNRDIARREALNAKLGHLPNCSLTRCAPGCKSRVAHIIIGRE